MTKTEVLEKWAKLIYRGFPLRREVISEDKPNDAITEVDMEVIHDDDGEITGFVFKEDIPWEDVDNKEPYYSMANKLWDIVG